ncbi:GspH/FimT family pseudopilin [Marinobacter caseinilyticus]|uniref:GspH/FimT family pseudopilin n=1 Tax=Marinobacter caseinilyticus TaxID=2692195 RepID=UPI00140B593E|nr:GspH/FimT family pseudopilin [Marinobacter caseinilyticus]
MSLALTSRRKSQSGFTLIELMVVIVLIGIAAAYAVPSFTQLIANNRVSSTVNGLVGTLNFARSEAVKAGRTVNVRPADGASWDSGVMVWLDANGDNIFAGAEELRRYEDFDDSLTLATAGALSQIGFRGNGFLTPSPATTSEFELSVSSPNITGSSFVCVGFSGRIRTDNSACN